MRNNNPLSIEIIAVGSELLTPFHQDTNSLYITRRLNDLGLKPNFKSVVGDTKEDLRTVIANALSRSHLIFATGGLGPTEDDLTKEAFASVLERKLIFKEEILRAIQERFKRRGYPMPSVNMKQAYIIEGSETLKNENGTAPGLKVDTGSKTIFLLPGPPHELEPIFESSVWPSLQSYNTHPLERRILKIAGLPESKIDTLIRDIYPRSSRASITTLARPGQIELHLTSQSEESPEEAENCIEEMEMKLRRRLKDNIFSFSGEEIEEIVGKMLRESHKTLSVAESCTGGYLGHRITNVPGSSDYFIQGVQVYSDASKIRLLGIDAEILHKKGAVSGEIAEAMASGVRSISQASFGLAVTGIAGPGGGSAEKPVGLVYTALAWEKGHEIIKNAFLGNRETVKYQSSQKALDMLRRHLLKLRKD